MSFALCVFVEQSVCVLTRPSTKLQCVIAAFACRAPACLSVTQSAEQAAARLKQRGSIGTRRCRENRRNQRALLARDNETLLWAFLANRNQMSERPFKIWLGNYVTLYEVKIDVGMNGTINKDPDVRLASRLRWPTKPHRRQSKEVFVIWAQHSAYALNTDSTSKSF